MKCIIADDEYWVRVSLASMLMEIDPTIEIVGEVSNGAALLDVLAQLQPDVVFVDIRMPRMSGLDCMRAARPMYPDIQWVILSGFSEFEFAREAISLGAMEYLIKPARRETLEQTLEKARGSIREKNRGLRKMFRHDLYALMYDNLLETRMEEMDFTACLFGVDSGLKWSEQKRLTDEARRQIAAQFGDMPDVADFMLASGRYALVSYGKDREKALNDVLERVIAETAGERFAMTACAAGTAHGAIALRDRLRRCEELFELRIPAGVGRVIRLAELEAIEQTAGTQMCGMCADLEMLPQRVSPMRVAAVDEKQLENLCKFICLTTGVEVPPHARRRWPEYLSTSAQTARNADFVAMAKEYIQANYAQDIGVAQIAEVLQITPNYLSTLFRKVEGITLIRYLTGIRLEHARALLENSQLRISQIAREAGYADSHYFTRVFKENFGFYPNEYRKEHEKKDERDS